MRTGCLAESTVAHGSCGLCVGVGCNDSLGMVPRASYTTNPKGIMSNQALSLVSGQAFLKCVETRSKTGTTTRLMTKQEFKKANPSMKGNALTNAYNNHIKDHGKAMASASVAFINQSGLLLKSVRNTKNTVALNFVKPEALKAKTPNGRTISPDQMVETVDALGDKDLQALLDAIQAKLGKA